MKTLENWRHQTRLSPSQLAAVSGESLRTIWRRMDAGQIPFYKQGRRRWIAIADALAYAENGDPIDPAVLEFAEKARSA